MRIIRKIGLCLIFLSAVVLIMNSVLPHHHHHENVCFVVDHCENNESDHPDSHDDHNGFEHEHDNGDTDFCQLNNLFLTQSKHGNLAKVKLFQAEKDVSGLNCFGTTNHSLGSISSILRRAHSNKLYLLNPHDLTRALRAPPSC